MNGEYWVMFVVAAFLGITFGALGLLLVIFRLRDWLKKKWRNYEQRH